MRADASCGPALEDEFHPWSGFEHDWLGVDLQGNVAVFTTAGFDPVPAAVDQHLADVDAALDWVGQLPVIGLACDTVGAAGDYPDWDAYSAKGFYACDWQGQENGGPYRRLSSPAVPISVGQLPAEIRAVAQLAEFPLKFADEPEITF